jgi:DNA polymerase I
MRKSLLFDIETNGLLREVTKVHCMTIIDTATGDQWSYKNEDMEKGLEDLYEAETLIGHNILAFDLPVLSKVYGWHPRPGTNRLDTLVVARLLHPDIKKTDAKRLEFPRKLVGSHKLEAWGLRLGEPKSDYQGGWENWSQEMHDYMEQDGRSTLRLLNHLKPWEYPHVPLDLEHRVAYICGLMEYHGWKFNTKGAQDLYSVLVKRRDELEQSLVAEFGSWQEIAKVYEAKKDNKKRGIKKGDTVTNYKTVTFNPGSRRHIEKKLRELGWKPKEFTESGQAKLDEEVLVKIDLPEAKQIVEYLLIQKRLGQVADGDNGWLRLVDGPGFIHGYINSGGTVTGRATHSYPNISQVPSVRAHYGKECRSLFTVPEGWKLVGADMSSLELRTFAHYLSFYDGGAYGQLVTTGDVHTHNQQAAGLPTRDHAKTFIFALLYGAGDQKIGTIIGGSHKHGKRLKEKFFKGLPAYSKLTKRVHIGAAKGFLIGLDGRWLQVRATHAALNTLLQGAGAILCKQWLADFYDAMWESGYDFGYDGDYVIVGWIHDELQVACREEISEDVGKLLVECARAAGEPFNFRIPLDSSYSIGETWADTH